MPVFCQYRLPNAGAHRTKYHKHGANVYFEDTHVVLTGLMKQQEFREFLAGPPLEIEVHDRDRKAEPAPGTPGPSAGFSQETGTSSLGIAHLSLSELLTAQTRMEVQLQIRGRPPPRRSRGRPGAANTQSLPRGDYLGANSALKVRIELTCPLSKKGSGEPEASEGPFGRIIYLLHHKNLAVLSQLRSEVLSINLSALQLRSGWPDDAEKALFNYGVHFRIAESQDLDVISGFHVMDQQVHIFVLEGLKHKAVKRLWASVPMR